VEILFGRFLHPTSRPIASRIFNRPGDWTMATLVINNWSNEWANPMNEKITYLLEVVGLKALAYANKLG
jgi:hypothetical protein